MMKGFLLIMAILTGCTAAQSKVSADVYTTTAAHEKLGTINFKDTDKGLYVSVDLQGLPAGEHGFHIHEFADCGMAKDAEGVMQAALKAGGHYDPQHTGRHLGPHGNGHRGDLPALNVKADGTVKTQFLLPHLSAAELANRSVIIHAGGDNYQDTPKPLGGGGARIACGIIKADKQ